MFLADLVEPAELDLRAAFGLVSRHPVLDVRRDLLIEMEAHLFVELAVDPVAFEERAKTVKKIDHGAPAGRAHAGHDEERISMYGCREPGRRRCSACARQRSPRRAARVRDA